MREEVKWGGAGTGGDAKKKCKNTIEMVFDGNIIVIEITLAIVQMSEAALENSNLNHFFLFCLKIMLHRHADTHSRRDIVTRLFTVKCEDFGAQKGIFSPSL